jgi:glycerate kinase
LRILLAPDKFKSTLDAASAGTAMAAGVCDVLPDAEVRVHPLADGGEGTLDCLAASATGTFVSLDAEDAFGSAVTARVFDTGPTAMLAMHETARLPPRPTPAGALRASSRGTGLAIAAARERLPDHDVVVFVGGSASTDGGAGAAQSWGWRLADAGGRELAPGGGALRSLMRVTAPAEHHPGRVTGACDVDAPLLGPAGAAAGFAPQKGAGPREVRLLEEGLANLAARIDADLGLDVAGLAGAGAGGGFGAGLVAFFGATLTGGFDLVAQATSLDDDLAWADVVLTGEGRVDEGTLRGKVVARVAERCSAMGRTCGVVAGEIRLAAEHLPPHETLGVAAVAEVVSVCGRRDAFAEPGPCVRATAGELVRTLTSRG